MSEKKPSLLANVGVTSGGLTGIVLAAATAPVSIPTVAGIATAGAIWGGMIYAGKKIQHDNKKKRF